MCHARRRIGEMLGQRRKWSSRFRQHIACGNNSCTHGRQFGCTQRWCSHQYGHDNNNHDNHDYDDNNYDNHNYDNHNYDNHHDNGCTDYYNVNDNHHDNGCTDYYNVNVNHNVIVYDHNGRTNHNIDDFINDTSAQSCATAHHQRIRQQHTRVKSRSETATQQTWCAVARWRFGVVRGVPRVKLPQSRQPAHGETVAICLYLSIGPRPWAGGHLKHSVLPVISGSEHYC
jgi:hypothetical protein